MWALVARAKPYPVLRELKERRNTVACDLPRCIEISPIDPFKQFASGVLCESYYLLDVGIRTRRGSRGRRYSHPDCRRLSDGENGHGALRLDVRSWSSNPQSCIDRCNRLIMLPWRVEPVFARLRSCNLLRFCPRPPFALLADSLSWDFRNAGRRGTLW